LLGGIDDEILIVLVVLKLELVNLFFVVIMRRELLLTGNTRGFRRKLFVDLRRKRIGARFFPIVR